MKPTRALRRIAKHVKGAPAETITRPPTPTTWSRGVIAGVNIGFDTFTSTTINLAGSTTPVPCDVMSTYTPTPGDIVEVLVLPGRLLVLGTSVQATPGALT